MCTQHNQCRHESAKTFLNVLLDYGRPQWTFSFDLRKAIKTPLFSSDLPQLTFWSANTQPFKNRTQHSPFSWCPKVGCPNHTFYHQKVIHLLSNKIKSSFKKDCSNKLENTIWSWEAIPIRSAINICSVILSTSVINICYPPYPKLNHWMLCWQCQFRRWRH